MTSQEPAQLRPGTQAPHGTARHSNPARPELPSSSRRRSQAKRERDSAGTQDTSLVRVRWPQIQRTARGKRALGRVLIYCCSIDNLKQPVDESTNLQCILSRDMIENMMVSWVAIGAHYAPKDVCVSVLLVLVIAELENCGARIALYDLVDQSRAYKTNAGGTCSGAYTILKHLSSLVDDPIKVTRC